MKKIIHLSILSIVASVCMVKAAPPTQGKDFTNLEGVSMDFRKKSNSGNPFWRSKTAPLVGITRQAQFDHCLRLTNRARQAGNLPVGYSYFPNINNDGKYVLCLNSELGASQKPLAIATSKPGFYLSPFASTKPALDLSNQSVYISGRTVKCPYTGNVFQMP